MTAAALTAALAYAARGWYVLPTNEKKRPLTEHGLLDSSTDIETIAAWWEHWPDAQIGIATGERSGFVALDIDVRAEGSGLDTLEELGIYTHPSTPTAHTPSGGVHCLFQWPDREIGNSVGKIGRFLDVRGDGGFVVVPPGAGRFWDQHLGIDTPFAPMPAWMVPVTARAPQASERRPSSKSRITRYGEVALDRAVEAIIAAPDGQQRDTLNRESFAIGGLVAGGIIPAALALQSLEWAAQRIPTYDSRHPWHPEKLRNLVRDAFLDGQAHPRSIPA